MRKCRRWAAAGGIRRACSHGWSGEAGQSRSDELGLVREISVIADVRSDFAEKYPIGPAGVHQDHRQEHEFSDQEKRLRSLRGRGLPQGEMVGYDHRIKTDRDADIR